jgi:hypothetical protein
MKKRKKKEKNKSSQFFLEEVLAYIYTDDEVLEK